MARLNPKILSKWPRHSLIPRIRLTSFGRGLNAKLQDEAKALELCRSKVRQRKLPMEVVDAEYQWFVLGPNHSCFCTHKWHRDRRKLTFYFVAEKRIDFRELVRELFRYADTSRNEMVS